MMGCPGSLGSERRKLRRDSAMDWSSRQSEEGVPLAKMRRGKGKRLL
jgi:hypothetical protein